MKVLICDDAVLYPTLLSSWFRDDPEIEVTGTVSTGAQALEQAGELQPDVVLLDHLLSDAVSDELAPRLRERVPGVRIVLVSGLAEDELAEAAAAIGAEAWVRKASTQEAVRDALLRGAAAGREGDGAR